MRGPGGTLVDGTAQADPGEQSWQLVPGRAWDSAPHQLTVDPVLEDLAGNSVTRVFDRDLTRPEERARPAQPVTVSFCPG